MSSVPKKNDDVLAQENGAVVADDEMKSNDSDNSLSSSIGVLSDGVEVEGEDGEEAQSKDALEDSLNSLQSLEAALPFKRGISDFYTGKSKSFMNLSEVKCLKEMEKEESPLNKRRRLAIAQNNTLYKLGSNSSSMPHLTQSDGENVHNVGVEREFKSSTNNASFSSIDNSSTKPSIN